MIVNSKGNISFTVKIILEMGQILYGTLNMKNTYEHKLLNEQEKEKWFQFFFSTPSLMKLGLTILNIEILLYFMTGYHQISSTNKVSECRFFLIKE